MEWVLLLLIVGPFGWLLAIVFALWAVWLGVAVLGFLGIGLLAAISYIATGVCIFLEALTRPVRYAWNSRFPAR